MLIYIIFWLYNSLHCNHTWVVIGGEGRAIFIIFLENKQKSLHIKNCSAWGRFTISIVLLMRGCIYTRKTYFKFGSYYAACTVELFSWKIKRKGGILIFQSLLYLLDAAFYLHLFLYSHNFIWNFDKISQTFSNNKKQEMHLYSELCSRNR